MDIYITPEAYELLFLYAELAPHEISGLGEVTLEKGAMYIRNIHLLEQESSGAETELKPEAVADLMTALITEGRKPESLKLWWHSHANMGVFWSGTDENTAGKFGNGWMLSVVVNKRREYKARLDVYDPVHLKLEDITMKVVYPTVSPELRKLVEEEVKEKVAPKHYSVVSHLPIGHPYVGRNGRGWDGDSFDEVDYYGEAYARGNYSGDMRGAASGADGGAPTQKKEEEGAKGTVSSPGTAGAAGGGLPHGPGVWKKENGVWKKRTPEEVKAEANKEGTWLTPRLS